MKWKSKPRPQLGDRKEKEWFAIFPRRVQGLWVWLEKYIAVYERQEVDYEDEEVVSSGVLTEKYRTVTRQFEMWVVVERKFIQEP